MQSGFIGSLNQAPEATALIMLIFCIGFHTGTLNPGICLMLLSIVCQIIANRQDIIQVHGGTGIWITVPGMILQILSIAGNRAGLTIFVLGPGVLCRISNGDDSLPLIVKDITYIHIQGCFVGNSDIRCTIRCQYPTITGASKLTCKINLAPLGINIFHHQLVGGRVPINLRHIVKELFCVVPCGTAIVDLVHGTVLNDSRPVSRHGFCRR